MRESERVFPSSQGHRFRHTSASTHPAEVSLSKTLKTGKKGSVNDPDIKGVQPGLSLKALVGRERVGSGFWPHLSTDSLGLFEGLGKVWTLKEKYASCSLAVNRMRNIILIFCP